MHGNITRVSLAALAVVGALGCGGPSTPTQLYEQEVDVLCKYAARCGEIGQSEISTCSSQARDAESYSLMDQAYDVTAAVTAGRIAVDGSAANNCFSAFNSLSCSGFGVGLPASCTKLYRGLVANGGSCQATQECSSGFCATAGHVTSPGCVGTCVPFASEGATCFAGACDSTKDFCNASSVCAVRGPLGSACLNFDSSQCEDGLVCLNSTCSKGAALGASCSGTSCAAGLYCPAAAGTAAVCTATVGSGQPCSDPRACQDGFRCGSMSVSGAGTCQAQLDLGSSCNATTSPELCPFDAPCSATSGLCSQPTTGIEGSVCSPGMFQCNSSSFLGVPLYCDSTTLKCTRLHHNGDTCSPQGTGGTVENGCTSYNCDSTTHTCVTPTLTCN